MAIDIIIAAEKWLNLRNMVVDIVINIIDMVIGSFVTKDSLVGYLVEVVTDLEGNPAVD